MELVRRGRVDEPVLLVRGFSLSGGGVGGKTFRLMTGGALWSRGALLERFR